MLMASFCLVVEMHPPQISQWAKKRVLIDVRPVKKAQTDILGNMTDQM